ncbi:MAG: PAS domain S-box protein [Candidatus Hydrogenedentes bacterium]|nr:PAS domain S-box protein [Candidatus Hydrogenedentota bacterium]
MAEQDKPSDDTIEAALETSPKAAAASAAPEGKAPQLFQELQRIQAALVASREQYLDFYDLAPVGYLTLDKAGYIRDVNYTATTLLGANRDVLIGSPARTFIQPEDRHLFDQYTVRIFASSQPQLVELRMVRSETHPFWVRLGAVAARDKDRAGICRMVVSDISEHRQTEDALAKYETRYRALYESTGDAVMLLDDKSFFDCNEATVKMFGCSNAAEFCTKHPADLSPPRQPNGMDSVLQSTRHIATALSYGANRFEWVHKRCDDGREFPAEVFLSRLKVDGRSAVMAIVKDISARKQAEAALARYETRYRVLFESTRDAVMLLDERTFFDANPATLAMFGCRNVAEFCKMHPADVSPPYQPCGIDSHTLANRRIAEALEKGFYQFEWIHRRTDTGVEFPAEIRLSRMHMDGRPMLQAVVRDITDRKQDEQKLRDAHGLLERRVQERTAQLQEELEKHRHTQLALRESEQQLHNLADNLPNAVVYQVVGEVDGARKFTYVGHGVERLNEVSAEDVKRDPEKLYGQVLPEYRAIVEALEKDALMKKLPVRTEVQSRLPSGRIRWFEYASTPRQRADGTMAWDGVEVDITARKLAEESLREMNRHLEEATEHAQQMAVVAEEANNAKTRFLANMSHEIRTPLNAIIGYAQLLKRDGSLTEKQLEEITTIYRSGEHLLALINEILDLSRIEAGRVELNPTAFCLRDMLEDFDRMFRFSAEAKGLGFALDCQDNVPSFVKADASKLRQIFINLLGNAVKFTGAGSVIMRVGAESGPESMESGSREVRLLVEVEDSGPGIPQEELDHLFCGFRQTEASRRSGGAGLGLAISRRLVEAMGGELSVESAVGRGSCFRFSVPMTLAEESEAVPPLEEENETAPDPAAARPRVLIVDDNADMRGLLRDLLAAAGYELEEAGNGRDAVELFERWAPDAVLMDMRMPVMDGYEAIRRIKATEKGKQTVIIAETASAFAEDKESILQAGADGYISKPFRMREVLATLKTLLLQRNTGMPAPPEA